MIRDVFIGVLLLAVVFSFIYMAYDAARPSSSRRKDL